MFVQFSIRFYFILIMDGNSGRSIKVAKEESKELNNKPTKEQTNGKEQKKLHLNKVHDNNFFITVFLSNCFIVKQ